MPIVSSIDPMLADSTPLPLRQNSPMPGDRGDVLELLFAHMADGLLVVDPYACILEANPAACSITGFTRDELTGMTLAAIVQGASTEEMPGWLLALDTEAETITALKWKCRTKGGELRNLDVRVARLKLSGQGYFAATFRVVAATELAMQQQISDLRLSNERLVDSEQRLRNLIDYAPVMTWTGQTDGYIDFLSKPWLDFTGLKPEEASGWGWMAIFHPDDIDGLVGYWRSILAAGTPGEIEARMRRHDGEYHWFLLRGFPLYNADGVLVKWYGSTVDINDRKTQEILAQCQLKAMEHTLCSVARESNPARMLSHVLRMIAEQVTAHSISVWERKTNDELQMAATLENGKISVTGKDTAQQPQRITLMTAEHPVWREMYRTGTDCVWGEVEEGNLCICLCDREHPVWYPWHGWLYFDATVQAIYERLMNSGVQATLTVPMLIAGRVAGILSLRLTHKRQPSREMNTLIRALAHQAMLAIHLMRAEVIDPMDQVQI